MKDYMKNTILSLLLMSISNVATFADDSVIQKTMDSGWSFRQVGTQEWLPATVPGCNHTDLLNNKRIKDPFWRLNEADLQWIDKEDWEYKTTFKVDSELLKHDRVALDFKGLDTYAEVTLNGNKILTANNMFREWRVDVKKHLKSGSNKLHVLFRSPVIEGLKKYDAMPYVIPVGNNDRAKHGKVEGDKRVSVYTRKAPYHFGWDWGPRLVSCGIWRPLTLNAWNQARIENVQIIQNSLTKAKASLTAVFEIESETSTSVTLDVLTDGQSLGSGKVNLKPGIHTYDVTFAIQTPKLWWCNGLGEPHLYNLTTRMTASSWSASKQERIGIRTIELVREKDDMGTSFYFKVNGVPVFMKGANMIPNDIYPARVTKEKHRTVIEAAKDSNFNMLRVWGGGFYQSDDFYDLCDEAGMLVWQDFMFACNQYPGDKAFLENVRQEAIDNVKRLRNHPCIALWCGNNEILVINWKGPEKMKRKGYSKQEVKALWQGYTSLFHDTLGPVVKQYDAARSYWPSSPSAGSGKVSRIVGLEHGDEHYWGVWHRKEPYETYSTYIARFMSEYGFQSFPELRTIKEFALSEDYGLLTDVMNHHQRSPVGNEAIEHYMLKNYRKPKDFESFLYVGQVLQAELIKYAVEAHRRARPFCMGTLYWQLNDCWPVASWSSMDSSLRWKAQQYFMKKAFAPVLVSPFIKKDTLNIHVVNDNLRELKGNLRLRLITVHGRKIWNKNVVSTVKKNSSDIYFSIDTKKLLKGVNTKLAVMSVEFVENGDVVADSIYYFRTIKELDLPTANVKATFTATEGGFDVLLKTDKLAKNIHMTLGDENGFFADNYFDMLPGQEVTVNLKAKISLEKLKEVFDLKILPDAF